MEFWLYSIISGFYVQSRPFTKIYVNLLQNLNNGLDGETILLLK